MASRTAQVEEFAAAEGRSRRPAEKFDARRDQLAESALKTLGELGYARTSLREIAQNSPFTHGVLHYYFRDKTDLITYCVRYYKAGCVSRYDGLIASAVEASALLEGFTAKLAETLVEDAAMHRLWYDLRSQSLFEAALRADVELIDDTLEQMIWRVLQVYADLAECALAVDAGTAYSLIDGLFQQALLDSAAGHDRAPRVLRERVAWLVPGLLRPHSAR